MRYNGLCVILERAAQVVGDPLVDRWLPALLLGALREDYWYLPLVGAVVEQPSLTHFWGPPWPGGFFPFLTPSARSKARAMYRRALVEMRAGRTARAFVLLGRASHLLTDMACPVHVHRVIHETDTYEWWIEMHRDELARLPSPPPPEARDVVALVEGLARATSAHAADKTHSAHGRLLRKLGLRRPLTREEVAAQARALVPLAIAHNAALLRLFLHESFPPVAGRAAAPCSVREMGDGP